MKSENGKKFLDSTDHINFSQLTTIEQDTQLKYSDQHGFWKTQLISII